MPAFLENPFVEGQLVFSFGDAPGATRYETWQNHLHVFQQLRKKAIDFIFPAPTADMVFFTEVKDFSTITKIGKYGKETIANY